jgi:hypothetical protein
VPELTREELIEQVRQLAAHAVRQHIYGGWYGPGDVAYVWSEKSDAIAAAIEWSATQAHLNVWKIKQCPACGKAHDAKYLVMATSYAATGDTATPPPPRPGGGRDDGGLT